MTRKPRSMETRSSRVSCIPAVAYTEHEVADNAHSVGHSAYVVLDRGIEKKRRKTENKQGKTIEVSTGCIANIDNAVSAAIDLPTPPPEDTSADIQSLIEQEEQKRKEKAQVDAIERRQQNIQNTLEKKVARSGTLRIDCNTGDVYTKHTAASATGLGVFEGRGSLWRRMFVPRELWIKILGNIPTSSLLQIFGVTNTFGEYAGFRDFVLDNEVLQEAAFNEWGDDQPPPSPTGMPTLEYYRLLTVPYCDTCSEDGYTNKHCMLAIAYKRRMCPGCRMAETCAVRFLVGTSSTS